MTAAARFGTIRPARACLVLATMLAVGACRSTGPAVPAPSGPPAAAHRAAPAAPSAPVPSGPLPDDSVPAIAQREVIRRQERIRQMDAAALKASQALAEEDLEGAVSGFRRAVDGL